MQLSREVKLGVTLILALILVTSMTLAVGKLNLGNKPVMELAVAYTNVDGLREGAPVRYSGVEVGDVRYIELSPYQVVVHIRINREIPIPEDSRFVIVTTGIIGDRHIEIQPGRSVHYLESGVTLTGENPVVIDSLLSEFYVSLQTLNNVVTDLSELASSEVLQDNIVQSTTAVREMAESFAVMLDSANAMTLEIQELTEGISGAQLQTLVDDLSFFASQLRELDVAQAAASITEFTSSLQELPLQEVAKDIKTFSAQLAAFDLSPWAGVAEDIQALASQVAALDLTSIETSVRDIEQFTSQLAEFPLEELGNDLVEITTAAKELPLAEFSEGMRSVINEVEGLPLQEVVGDLHRLTTELSAIGWTSMAEDVQKFTAQLAEIDINTPFLEITADLDRFSHQLNELDLVGVFEQVEGLLQSLQSTASALDGEQVGTMLNDVATAADNVRQLTADAGTLLEQLGDGAAAITQSVDGTISQLQGLLEETHQLISGINQLVNDIDADGTTVETVRGILEKTAHIGAKLEESLDVLSPDTTDSLIETMESIQQINQDIQGLKTAASSLRLSGMVGLSYGPQSRLGANLRLTLAGPEAYPHLVMGLMELAGRNELQLQLGKMITPTLEARAGLMGSHLGVGLDARLGERLSLGTDLIVTSEPHLTLRARYSLSPEWWMTIEAQDLNDLGFSWGVEYRF